MGRVETLGITPSQEQLSLLAEGQLQRSLGPHSHTKEGGCSTLGSRAAPNHLPWVG